ncbi:MAG TPA: family 43 glycosylhydrolase [Clostridia bacterium]
MKQAFNPFLPSYEYIPDGEPHIFGGRVYLYGSHDKFNGISFCLNDYVCWSAPVDNLADWRYEGVIFRRVQDPNGKKRAILKVMFAPDVCQGPDGKYYLYYFINGTNRISVAVCGKPAGKYEFLGHVRYPDGKPLGSKGEPLQFDPGVFVDDDNRIYLYTGFGHINPPYILAWGHKPTKYGPMGFELEQDMLTIKQGPCYIGVQGKNQAVNSPYKNHEFFEASSLRKFDGKYYFIYSSYQGHELCWAVSDNPLGCFSYGGTLISNGDVGINGRSLKQALNYTGNTHGSVIKIKDKYYVFYHRQTNRNQFSRQACAEEIEFKNGRFVQAEMTSCGLNGGSLKGAGKYPAYIACNLFSKKGCYWYGAVKRPKGIHPYFTQNGGDRESGPDQYIANFCDGAAAGYKYFELDNPKSVGVEIKGRAKGVMEVYDLDPVEKKGALLTSKFEPPFETCSPCAVIDIKNTSKKTSLKFESLFTKSLQGKKALYFRYKGKGRFDFIAFEIK